MAASTIKLKLLVDTKAKKVILAEAGKVFIAFLIFLLSLPLGTIARLLKEKSKVGNLCYLYESVENLPDSFVQPSQTKDTVLLNPRSPICATGIRLTLSDYDLRKQMAYRCPYHIYVADVPNICCRGCEKQMITTLNYVPPFPPSTRLPVEVGFVQGSSVTYIVLDNLEFIPMSPEYFVTLLKKF
ncbi:hypothetical protein LWI28_028874 [Acer negundo]|uniref:Uncharacterized protein n=1 Tax=Acer negundo TaxID=4023 RepID=A0AAD5IB67_ACENE|nr:hypothetical protein LWI28_028874 [Acer negundo]